MFQKCWSLTSVDAILYPSWVTCRGPSHVPTPTSRRTLMTQTCSKWWRSIWTSTTLVATSPIMKNNHMRWGQEHSGLHQSFTRHCIQLSSFHYGVSATWLIKPPSSFPGLLSERGETPQLRQFQWRCWTPGGNSEALPPWAWPLSEGLWGNHSPFTRCWLLHSPVRFVWRARTLTGTF